MSKELITGIDIGSYSIKVATAQVMADENLNIIGFSEVMSEGISKGQITNIEEAVTSLSKAIEKVEKMIGQRIESAFVGISTLDITSKKSKGVIAVSKASGEIQEEDVRRVIEAAQTISTPPNYEILHIIPLVFTVDNQTDIKDPVGMNGIRLEVEALLIEALSANIKNIRKVVYRTGIDIEELIVSPLASAEVCLSKKQKELGVAVLNIGAASTSISVFEERDPIYVGIIPIGSNHITSDIAIGLRTDLDTAEKIKLKYGGVDLSSINKREEIDLSDINKNEKGIVSKRHIVEIVSARVEEIFKLADKHLAKIQRSGKLPAGILLTGGGVKLDGILVLAKKIFRISASFGYPREIDTSIEKINDPSFTTVTGLIKFGYQERKDIKGASKIQSAVEDTIKKIRRFFHF